MTGFPKALGRFAAGANISYDATNSKIHFTIVNGSSTLIATAIGCFSFFLLCFVLFFYVGKRYSIKKQAVQTLMKDVKIKPVQ